MKVSFHTLGCKVNFAETSALARELALRGFDRARRGEAADVYVVNSCSVTAAADKKCRNLVARLHSRSPEAKIVVTGCWAQLDPERVAAIPGVEGVLGNGDKDKIAEFVAKFARADDNGAISPSTLHVQPSCDDADEMFDFFPAWSAGDRTRSFLKVQDGCDYKCSYCTIHRARGGSRNAPIADVVQQARRIAARGGKEIVITGINTGDFGRTTDESFIDLLRALDTVTEIERYRISSIEPNLLTDEIIDFCASSRAFQPHFHIPLQSGSDRILGLMRRRYTAAGFAGRVERVRRAMPGAFIGVDVIVGFPGETDEDFDATRRFLETVRPSQLHVFPYSVRPATPAAIMPGRVPGAVAAARAATLGALSEVLLAEFTARFTGTRAAVLWESGGTPADLDPQKTRPGDSMGGFTGNYLRVTAPYDPALVGTITEAVVG